MGNQITTRGKAKYLGGVGTKVTGITKRQFKPNLQSVHVTERGTNRTLLVCTQCLRSGAVTKKIKAVPFRLPGEAGAKPKGAVAAKTSPAAKIPKPAEKIRGAKPPKASK